MTSFAPSVARVLSIAGTDPSGGAGTAADMKSITAAGGYGMTVVTSLVAQNTTGVRQIHIPPISFLQAQLDAVSDDVQLDGVKTGMLANAEIIATVDAWLQAHRPPVVVTDPVMVATSGDRLLEPEAEEAMRQFCYHATVITPNIPELAVLVGEEPAADEHEAVRQAQQWATQTGVGVIVKTGHLSGRDASNLWVGPDGVVATAPSTRVDTTSTHGTGCSLSSALATRLAAGQSPADALTWTTDWLHEAIAHGSDLQVGKGHGPVDHGHAARRLAAAGSALPWIGDEIPTEWNSPDQISQITGLAADDPVTPAVEPAGPWTAALWQAGSQIARSIDRCDFVHALITGDLTTKDFAFYLNQDAHYLSRYARALAGLGARASRPDETSYWAGSAMTCHVVEAELHRTWLQGHERTPIGPVTSAYTDFLVASALGEAYVVGVTSVLPCYWLYAQTGAQLPTVPSDHPYAAWLDTYRDPAFVDSTRQALQIIECAFDEAAPKDRATALRAYLLACRHELEFFNQASRI